MKIKKSESLRHQSSCKNIYDIHGGACNSFFGFFFSVMIFFFISNQSLASESRQGKIENSDHPGFVEVEAALPIVETKDGSELLEYRKRKDSWGFVFGYSLINFYPSSYRSKLEGASFGSVFGKSDAQEGGAEFGVRWNTSFGSLGTELGWAQSAARGGDDSFQRRLINTRTSGSVSYTMNSLFREPYAAPYVQVGVYTMDYTEVAGDQTFSGTTAPATFLYVGTLLQLNWLEPQTARVSYGDFGLENTFLNLFIAQFMASGSGDDPKYNTDVQFGLGFKIEF